MTSKTLDTILRMLPHYPEKVGRYWGYGPLGILQSSTVLRLVKKLQISATKYG